MCITSMQHVCTCIRYFERTSCPYSMCVDAYAILSVMQVHHVRVHAHTILSVMHEHRHMVGVYIHDAQNRVMHV